MYKSILETLSWSNDTETQQNGVRQLIEDDSVDINKLIEQADKTCLQNIVLAVSQKNWANQYKSVDGLLILLQDLNWPGSLDGLNILKRFPKDIVLGPLENALKKAVETSDDMWLSNLNLLIKHFSYTQKDFANIQIEYIMSF